MNLSEYDGKYVRATHGSAELWTDHLILRRYRLDDAEQLYKSLGTDSEMNKYSGWNPYASLEMAQ